MAVHGVGLAFLVGMIPTIFMILASILLINVEVSSQIEACFQNFAAGLILGAVGCELFPIMLHGNKEESPAGITIGFAVGLILIFGLEYFIGYLEDLPNPNTTNVKHELIKNSKEEDVINVLHNERMKTYPEGMNPDEDSTETGNTQVNNKPNGIQWEDDDVMKASIAITSPLHREHIRTHLLEIVESVNIMESQSSELLDKGLEMDTRKSEELAEKIDEEIHNLQYKIDHCRRLLQGAETSPEGSSGGNTWITFERKVMIKKRLTKIKLIAEHLVEHINDPVIDTGILKEIYEHMDTMDRHIDHFHDTVETVLTRWRRLYTLPDTKEGDTLPMNLILPVTVDCFVDGLLIGISVAISEKAGIILGFANSLEMSFLGMAYASRLVKCTGSTKLMRDIALYTPPLIMFLSTGIGAALASSAENLPMVYIAFVAFGSVALLYLVCNELLIEAKNAQSEDGERWWISLCIFFGVYLVLIMDHEI